MIDKSQYLQRVATLLLLCAAAVGLVLDLDPAARGFHASSFALIKYLPYWAAYLAIPFSLLAQKSKWNRMMAPFLVFMVIMLVGACYALLVFHQSLEDTYLGRALGGGVCIAYFLLAGSRRELRYFMSRFGRMLLLVALLMFVRLLLFRINLWRSSLTQMYHTDVIIFTSSFILVSLFIKQKMLRRIMQTVFVLAPLLEAKATAFLSLAMMMTYWGMLKLRVWYQSGNKAVKFRKSLMSIFAFAGVVAAAASIMTFVVTNRLEEEDKVRAFTSQLRLGQFSDSPFAGSLFTTSPVVTVSYLRIPSHSDLIDLLAFGGVLTVMLFFIPLAVSIAKRAKEGLDPEIKQAYLLSKFIIINDLLIMSINPILSEPRLAFLFWGSIGVVLALQNAPRLLVKSGTGQRLGIYGRKV